MPSSFLQPFSFPISCRRVLIRFICLSRCRLTNHRYWKKMREKKKSKVRRKGEALIRVARAKIVIQGNHGFWSMRKVHNTCDLSVIARMQHISTTTTLPECKIQFVFCKAFFHACFWGITGGIIRYQLTPEGVQKMPLFLACLNVIRGFGQHQ